MITESTAAATGLDKSRWNCALKVELQSGTPAKRDPTGCCCLAERLVGHEGKLSATARRRKTSGKTAALIGERR